MNYYNYYTEIEDTFIRRRGKNLFLSPIDWALMEVWQERGIPLHVVIRSVESVFDVYDKLPPGTRTIKSLFYCREEIEIQYKEWVTAQTGKSSDESQTADLSGYSVEAVRSHMDSALEALQAISIEELREDADRAIDRLNELAMNLTSDFEAVDGTLGDIEKLLDRAMFTKWEKLHLKTLKKEVADQLRQYKAEMEAEAYKNTFELMLLKRLREEAGMPRLGLFYL